MAQPFGRSRRGDKGRREGGRCCSCRLPQSSLHGLRIAVDDEEVSARRSFGHAAALLPVAQGARRDPDQGANSAWLRPSRRHVAAMSAGQTIWPAASRSPASSGTASGSSATAWARSSSVVASTRAQSVSLTVGTSAQPVVARTITPSPRWRACDRHSALAPLDSHPEWDHAPDGRPVRPGAMGVADGRCYGSRIGFLKRSCYAAPRVQPCREQRRCPPM